MSESERISRTGQQKGMTKGNSLLETRRKNRVLIKNLIFRKRTALRTQIAKELELTLPTITTSVNEMMQEGVLEEITPEEDLRVKAVGRKPTMVRFRRDAATAVGIELGPYSTQAVLMNIRGEIIKRFEGSPANESYDLMKEDILKLIRDVMPEDTNKLLGIGVGLPGFIDAENGVIRSNFRTDWIGRNLAQDLERSFDLPVLIDNNVRLRAVGYSMCAAESDPDTFAYLFVSKGVACPLVLKRELLSGYSSGAGELGQTVIGAVFQEKAESGNEQFACRTVDELASERAIFERCQRELMQGKMRPLYEKMREHGRMTIEQILELQEKGDPEICGVMEVTMAYLGIALANVVNLVNPGFVVVDGLVMKEQANRDHLIRCARACFYGLNEEEVKILFTDPQAERGAAGAAFNVIQKQFLDI